MNNPTPKPCVRVLHLEDNEDDHVLVKELFAADGLICEFQLAKNREEFEKILQQGQFDVIVSDFSLPSYDGSKALTAAKRLKSDVPFIFFSGTIGEEIAVESLKIGATDFVIKERPGRLVAAVRRALQEVEDLARRKRVESTLRQTEERFHLIARATNDVIWERDFKTNTIWVGDNFEAVFGHDPETIGTAPEAWDQLIHPDDRQRVQSSVAALVAGGGRVWWSEFRLRRSNGSYAYVFSRAFVVYEEGRPARLVGATIDVTERKKAEEKIREQADLLDKASDAIIVCDLENRILFWNQSAEKVYGWKAEEVIGQPAEKLLFRERPVDLEEAQDQLLERGEWIGEIRQITKAGREIIVASRWTLVRDDEANPKSKLVFNTDITEMKNLEEQLLRAQRLESLGGLVSGIAHDLNNALVPVIMGIGFLKELPLPDKALEILDAMMDSSTRGAEMIKGVLTFARGVEGKKDLLQMDQLIREMSRIINDAFPKSIRCQTEIEQNLRAVTGFPTQLHQVLMNLCVNARDAMPQGGIIKLSAKNVVLDQAQVRQHPDATPGNYICLSVTDTGVGIPTERLAKIFQPFFTTKAPGKGTGLGLSTSQMIVKNHGGFMDVVSSPGKGSEFKIFLPAVETEAAAWKATSAALTLPIGNGQMVLVVDDESAILAIVKTTLENYGYQVITASSGSEAVTKLTHDRNAISLVITDVAMPLMDGAATVAALRSIKPELKVIVTSGFDQNGSPEHVPHINFDAFINKPFTVEKLVTVVGEVLAK